jgi:hypothetical protein
MRGDPSGYRVKFQYCPAKDLYRTVLIPIEFILMVMDGAGWRRARALSVPENTALIFLPPYSPQSNPVERILY